MLKIKEIKESIWKIKTVNSSKSINDVSTDSQGVRPAGCLLENQRKPKASTLTTLLTSKVGYTATQLESANWLIINK